METAPAALWRSTLAWLSGTPAQQAFAAATLESGWPREAAPSGADLEAVLAGWPDADRDTACRLVHMTWALAACLPLPAAQTRLAWPREPGPRFLALYPDRTARQPLLDILDHLEALRQSCDAWPDGTFQLVKAEGDVLHFTRTGPTEVANVICNRGPHVLAAPIGEKATGVNPFGFTITVEELGHNPNHSYYDVK